MSELYCRYCCKYWKLKKEFDNHLNCCIFFHQYRTDPNREMNDFGVKIPTQKELFALVYQLSIKCDRLEKEVKQLKSSISTKHRRLVMDLIHQPSQLPTQRFDEWWRSIIVTDTHLQKVFAYDLVEGMKTAIESHLKTEGKIPIRAFIEKPTVFYIYTMNDEKDELEWRIMHNTDLETMLVFLGQQFTRLYMNWQRENEARMMEYEDEKEKSVVYMMKVNGFRISIEKRLFEIRKWLFPQLQESVNAIQVEF